MSDSDATPPPADLPNSLFELERRFPTDDACAKHLFALRWPDGFVCPHCGGRKGWELGTKAYTTQCASCSKQTSVTAGTIMHRSHLSLRAWFWAAWLMAAHSNGISALQLQRQLGLGSYKTAWLLLAKLRRAMVDPDREPLAGLVEMDEATLPHRSAAGPAPIAGRSREGRMPLAGAVEVVDRVVGRLRLSVIEDYSSRSLSGFAAAAVSPGATLRTDGLHAYLAVDGYGHERHVIGRTPAHLVLEAIHRVFGNLKTWARGVYHGLRPPHLQSYLDEFVFRFNRRTNRPAGFLTLLRIGMKTSPKPYAEVILQEPGG